MRKQRAIAPAAALLAGTLTLSVAYGDCLDPRTILPADRAAMSAVITATLRALPPAPAGWVVTEPDETPDPLRSTCPESMRSP